MQLVHALLTGACADLRSEENRKVSVVIGVKGRETYLIEASVSDNEKQATVVGLDTVIDQDLNPFVDFLFHRSCEV